VQCPRCPVSCCCALCVFMRAVLLLTGLEGRAVPAAPAQKKRSDVAPVHREDVEPCVAVLCTDSVLALVWSQPFLDAPSCRV
jgi:hypothetical protein